jgi:nitroreductase
MLDLDQAIRQRHSTRMFLPRPVPRELVDEALGLAQYAPSNSNIQPWHMVFASGPPRDRLVAALVDEAKRRPPNIPPLPESFQHFRRELGAQVYGAMGIGIEDTAKHAAAVLRNWEFFRAPLAGIVCMHRDLGAADALSVGMFLQTLLLALNERDLGSCVEVAIAGYPEIVRAPAGPRFEPVCAHHRKQRLKPSPAEIPPRQSCTGLQWGFKVDPTCMGSKLR